jgi:hypothetical protein
MTVIGLLDCWRFGSGVKFPESRVAVTKAWGQLGNPNQRELPPLEAIVIGVMKRK